MIFKTNIPTVVAALTLSLLSTGFSQEAKTEEKKNDAKKEETKKDDTAADKKVEKKAEAQLVTLEPVPNVMQFKTKDIKVKAGQPVKLTFNNTDVLMHNVLVLKVGTKDKVGALADAMIADPQGMAKGYVPASTDIIAQTKLLMSTQSETIEFTLDDKGVYPFICTFPGHWRIMQGTITAE
jgi:azurin